ncbi:hypothetical protein [Natronomonas sp. EA1]|uniref:hypothetical protein n=1 Tax=Natronomonas sp. EA1 TaxID=3421655 RepID=UPI003EB6DE9A
MSIADAKNNKQVVRKLNTEIFNERNYGKIEGFVMNRIENGKIAESFVCVDFLGLLDQIGAIEIPKQA